MSALPSIFYNSVSKRFSTILLAVSAGAFVFDLTFNKATDAYWRSNNKGKLWVDIEPKVRAMMASEEE
uniref:Complex III subunit 9 n=1 Tax=Parastrongyloides trichosuri TaxID=131310 RepID=A0A0N4ZIE9_PARTI